MLKRPALSGDESDEVIRFVNGATSEIERLQATIQAVADNLGCGPANVVEWSAKVKAGLLELDRLQQEAAQSARRYETAMPAPDVVPILRLNPDPLHQAAADEIERLRASRTRLIGAIMFARAEGFEWPSDPLEGSEQSSHIRPKTA